MDVELVLEAIARANGGVLYLAEKHIRSVNLEFRTQWKPSDMGHPYKARAIGRLYLSHYCRPSIMGRMPTEEDAVRIWFGGPLGWAREWTRSHWLRVEPTLSRLRGAVGDYQTNT